MKEFETLFDKAKQNFHVAKNIHNLADEDEAYLNYVAYHLQQSVELTLKFYLENNGVHYPKTHDIDQLIRILRTQEIACPFTEYIDDHSEMFSLWKARTRYVLNFSAERVKVERAISEVGKFLDAVERDLTDNYSAEKAYEESAEKILQESLSPDSENQKDKEL